MKKLIVIVAALASFNAFADSAITAVGKFKGSLAIDTETLNVKEVSVEVVHQFCNIWGTTCAGGPSQRSDLPISTTVSENNKVISIFHDFQYEYSATKIGNRFSSCKVILQIEAINAEGRTLRGSYNLLWANDKKVCASEDEVTAIIQSKLAQPLKVTDGGILISIRE